MNIHLEIPLEQTSWLSLSTIPISVKFHTLPIYIILQEILRSKSLIIEPIIPWDIPVQPWNISRDNILIYSFGPSLDTYLLDIPPYLTNLATQLNNYYITMIFVTEKNSYGLGCTIIDRETAEINPFPICKRNKTSNTKGSRIIPYSGCLK